MFRLISALFAFFSEVSQHAKLDPDHAGSGDEETLRHVSGHRRIVAISATFGGIGLALGLALVVAAFVLPDDPPGLHRPNPRGDQELKGAIGLLIVPFILGAVGLVFGGSAACAFAPREFFESPIGRRWLGMIGVEGVGPARVVCLLVAGIIAAAAAGIAYVLLTSGHH